MPNDASRTRRTPAMIATDELAKAEERVEKATKRVEKAEAEAEAASRDLARAERFRDYAASNPDLPEPEAVPEDEASKPA